MKKINRKWKKFLKDVESLWKEVYMVRRLRRIPSAHNYRHNRNPQNK